MMYAIKVMTLIGLVSAGANALSEAMEYVFRFASRPHSALPE